MSTNKPLSEQMKTAGALGGAALGGTAGVVLENFLQKNPHLINWAGEGLHKKIPKGLGALGAVGGAYVGHQESRNG